MTIYRCQVLRRVYYIGRTIGPYDYSKYDDDKIILFKGLLVVQVYEYTIIKYFEYFVTVVLKEYTS